MKVVFASEVWQEVADAQDFYEAEVDGLGKAFVQVLFQSIEEIKRFPTASRIIREPFRRFLTPRFPYGIIFKIDGEIIHVVAVAHLKRKPFYWKNRRLS